MNTQKIRERWYSLNAEADDAKAITYLIDRIDHYEAILKRIAIVALEERSGPNGKQAQLNIICELLRGACAEEEDG